MERVKGFSVLRSWPAALDDFRNWLISARRPLSLGVNRLTALEHFDNAAIFFCRPATVFVLCTQSATLRQPTAKPSSTSMPMPRAKTFPSTIHDTL